MVHSNPFTFFSKVLEYENSIENVFDLHVHATQEFHLERDGEKILIASATDVAPDSPVEFIPIKPSELVRSICKLEKTLTQQLIDQSVDTLSIPLGKEYINKQVIKLDYLVSLYDVVYKEKKAFVAIKQSLLDLRKTLLVKYQHLIDKKHYRTPSISLNSSYKITWCGSGPQLATLFYDLNTTVKSQSGKPMISNDWKELKDWILQNFEDEKNEPFSADTIAGYLSPKKPYKKIKGNRIKPEIP